MKRLIVCALAHLALVAHVQAGTVTIDFENLSGSDSSVTTNFQTNGFVFSPQCHYDVFGGPSGNALGFDRSGCDDGFNNNYLGPATANRSGRVYVAALDGSAFSLLSLLRARATWSVSSSAGGYFDASSYQSPFDEFPVFSFSGAQWENLQWLVFEHGGGSPQGFDNLTLATADTASVPEPGFLGVLALGLLGLTRASRQPGAAATPQT